MDQYIGKLLDNRYEILEVIGMGGMSVVYKARCRVLNRFVAIKILKNEYAQDEEFRRRFYMESQAVAKLSHNNIVSVYDVSHTQGLEYIVMELMEGITLKEYLQKKGHLSWQESLFFAQQIARALSHAHSRGIIHQDIKPQNIIILRDGTAKVTDFGIASFAAAADQETRVVQEAIGSVHYISPEQAKGSTIDFRTDLYSLGVVMYEMLTGKLPFEGETALSIVMQHISAMPLLPSEVVTGIPRGMDDIVMHAMCPAVGRRYASAEELYNDLQRLKNDPEMAFSYDGESIRNEAPSLDATQALPNYAEYRKAAPAAPRQPLNQGARYQPVHEEEQAAFAPRPARKKGIANSPMAVATIAVVCFVVLSVVIASALIFSGGKGKMAEVPSLVGKNISDSSLDEYVDLNDEAYQDFKFKTETKFDENGVDGEILAQDPTAGERVEKGTTITLTVCISQNDEETDEYTIENFENYTYDEVKERVAAYDIQLRRSDETSDTIDKDKVIRTEPAAGETLKRGGTLEVFVSLGKENLMGVMINVVGAPVDEAKTALKALDIVPEIHMVASDKEKDIVVSQSVPEGETVKSGKTVILEVSSGVAAPDTGDDGSQTGDGGNTGDSGGSSTPQAGSATLQISVPASERESARIVVKQSDGTVLYDNTVAGAGEYQIVTVEGSGTQMLTVTINGGYTTNQEVTFQ
ncbi:MAG: Stk1 family PASTA domain-containing Ser/Thr kinase [Intestinibacillus sp.]